MASNGSSGALKESRLDVCIYTENYGIGGNDRFLIDLAAGLDRNRYGLSIAGNANPRFDAWLSDKVPWMPGKTSLPIRSVVDHWSLFLERRRTRVVGDPVSHDSSLRGTGDAPWTHRGSDGVTVRAVGSAALRVDHWMRNYFVLKRYFARRSPDVVHVHNGGYPGAESCRIASIAAKDAGVAGVVQFVHNTAFPPAWPASVERRMDRRVARATDCWITAARRTSAALVGVRDVPAGTVETINYGIPPPDPVSPEHLDGLRKELAFPSSGRFILLMVAAFEQRKGHAVLLDALKRLDPAGDRIHTVFVGEGELEVRIKQRAVDLGLGGCVRFLGRRDDAELVMELADALVLPSFRECLPYVILEAMSRGLPVVGTDVAGIPEEVVDGVTGLVVPPGDAHRLAGAIEELVLDRDRAVAMGERGRVRQQTRFTLDRMVAQVCETWDRARLAAMDGRT